MLERTYTWNGKTLPISKPHMTDIEVAAAVRMLMRNDLAHEHVCCMARDRIVCLSEEKDALERHLKAERDRAARLDAALRGKEAAMEVLFRRLKENGIDTSDLIP